MRQERGIVLSGRLQMLADMVTPGNIPADVGCDHGFLSIYLVEEGICPRAVAMDVREGPLLAAEKHVRESGLGDYISLRLSDGLAECRAGEADTLICAGMGGRLMERILTEGMEKAAGMKELILQPQSELAQFRAFLRKAGFSVVREEAVLEEGKFYFAMKAVYGMAAGDRKAGAPEGEGMAAAGDRKAGALEGEGVAAAGERKAGAPEGEGVAVAGKTGPGTGIRGPAEQDTDLEPARHLYDLYGEKLLLGQNQVLRQFLEQREAYLERLSGNLARAGTGKADMRLREVCREQEDVRKALAFYR